MFEYKEFVRQIKEGLILTHDMGKYKSSLEIELNSIGVKDYNIETLNKFQFYLEIFNLNNLKNDTIKFIADLIINLFGYYPSYVWVENNKDMKNGFIYDEKYLDNKYKSIKIKFEAKYEDGLYKNSLEIPEIAYHLTPQKNKERILKTGLYPKRANRKGLHPERIYMFYDINNYEFLLKMLKKSDIYNGVDYNYMLLEVNLPTSIIIHTDPNYNNGFFTYDNIPHANIKILKENL